MKIQNISDAVSVLKENMDTAIESYKVDISGIRTGRISPSFLNSVVVKAYNNNMHLNQLASITVQDSKFLVVQVWDLNNVDAVNKAILTSDLGLTPAVEGSVLKMIVPQLNQERRQELVKVASKCAERCKVSLRNIRRNIVDIVKKYAKENFVSEDASYKIISEIDDTVTQYIKKIDQMLNSKTSEILKD